MRLILSVIPEGVMRKATVAGKGVDFQCHATAISEGPALAQATADALRVLAQKLEDGELQVEIRLDRPVEVFLPLVEKPKG